MTIRLADVPEGGAEMIGRAIAPLFLQQPGGSGSGPVAGTEGGGLIVEPAAPHPVFVAGIQDVLDERLLSSAQQGGWRYLLLRGDEAVGSATVEQDAATGGLAFSHVTQGPFVDSTVEGIRRADQIARHTDEDFVLRLLDIPALYLRTLWLHGTNSDLLMPLDPVPPPLEAYRVYSEKELVDAVHASAARRAAYGDHVGG